MPQHIIRWAAPAPLWSELIQAGPAARVEFAVPAILRFATDDFMQVYSDTLATDPRRLGEFRAVPETWRGRLQAPTVPTPVLKFALPFQRRGNQLRRANGTGAKQTPSSDASALPRLKLYQPAHQRFYLLCACLVCESAGLPDRRIDAGHEERISFVVRRLFPRNNGASPVDPADADEYAWVKTGESWNWMKVLGEKNSSERTVLLNEERLPLFPTVYQEDDLRSRRLVSGLIPVAKREAYLGAQRFTTPPANGLARGTTEITARKILFRKQVTEPWKALVAQAAKTEGALTETVPGGSLNDDQRRNGRRASREQIQVASWLILLDFADFLKTHIPELWSAVVQNTRPAAAGALRDAWDVLNGATQTGAGLVPAIRHEFSDLDDALVEIYGSSEVPGSLRAALARFGQAPDQFNETLRNLLETAAVPYDRLPEGNRAAWPDFVFPLADPEFPTQAPVAGDIPQINLSEEEKKDQTQPPPPHPLDELAAAIVRAMPAAPTGPEPEVPMAAKLPADQTEAVFVIRCVYERPACGPLHEDVVSEPTEPFELAGFFDPDAPARPIRIGLPLDTSPAGLRKFDKNTAFILSDMLCGQVNRMRGLGFGDLVRSVLPWPLNSTLSGADEASCKGADNNPIGTICSLSIPIITICAFVLLIIMVTLLDMIFRWLPYFIICFPLPGLKGKKP